MTKEIILAIIGIFLLSIVWNWHAHAQITHEATISAEVPLWFELSTSTDTVFIKTNGNVKISNPSNNYEM